jgi:hypothetical protein
VLLFRDLDREYLVFGGHLLEPSTSPAVTFRGVIPPSPER